MLIAINKNCLCRIIYFEINKCNQHSPKNVKKHSYITIYSRWLNELSHIGNILFNINLIQLKGVFTYNSQ